ncbi:hypothetical protein [Escherichia coli]|uniref:hypothetical protein n=1 Tax=Escherichia coli TaxID=562 RepID=UPI000CDCF4AB|nr:hypothetical protein [Escherichia coli]MEA0469312.1 hypothetical protein [Escherichia coli]HCN9141213.1 hypothetical protein [Escherichia coli]
MSYIKPDTPYSVYARSLMMGKAIIKAQYNKQVPLTLMAMPVLTDMSISRQDLTNVCRLDNFREPMNIYTMVVF